MTGSLQRGVAIAAALVLLVALGWTVLRPVGQYRVTAYFNRGRRALPGLRRADPGHRRRHDRRTSSPRATGCAWTWPSTTTYKIPADAEAVILAPSLVSDRYVQFAPVYDGGPDDEGRRRGPALAHRHPGRARPGLRRARPALRRARAERGQQERRAVRPGRRRRRQPQGQRRAAQPDPRRVLPGGAHAGGQPQRPVRLAGQPADVHQRAGHDRRPGAASSTRTWPPSPPSWPTSARTWPQAVHLLSRRSARSPRSSATTPPCSPPT